MTQDLEKYALSILKPDAFRDYLTQMIIADFEAAELSVIFRKELILTMEQAMRVYHEQSEDHARYPFMVNSMILHDWNGEQLPCMLLMFKSDQPNGLSALELAQRAKGRADRDGIRKRYTRYQVAELKAMGYQGEELMTLLSRNRLHIPDDYQGVLDIVELLITERDLETIRCVDPQCANFIETYRKKLYSLMIRT